ncbi:hypothetical protein OPV22_001602 [Ensete ventricosum]|uniref:Uncharacterized protein n=1 Tax=Ensete ventricosum TaxID=4639 RepID=A0AAV8RWC7_ENSVE|nr:hypothetical protein OPV22_001602 [Ensete ventricosum]
MEDSSKAINSTFLKSGGRPDRLEVPYLCGLDACKFCMLNIPKHAEKNAHSAEAPYDESSHLNLKKIQECECGEHKRHLEMGMNMGTSSSTISSNRQKE